MAKNITYKTFAEWAIALGHGTEDNIEDFDIDLFIDKAEKLLERETKKAEYTKSNRKPTVSKASEQTIANAEAILSILSVDTPMTTSEINEALGTNLEPLAVSNAIAYMTKNMGVKVEKSKKPEQVVKVKNGINCTDTVPKTAYSLIDSE